MAQTLTAPPGALYARAAQFANELEAGQAAAADQMLASWAGAYAATRVEIDALIAKRLAAQAAGLPMSPAWLYQQQRLKSVLDTAKQEIDKFAVHASQTAVKAQWSAVQAAAKHAQNLGHVAVAEGLPGLEGTFTGVNPENLKHLGGFLADGSPLSTLFAGMGTDTAARLRRTLITTVALGKGTDWAVRHATADMGIARTRAETIMRTESLRAYRATSRSTFQANGDVVKGWRWHAHLDTRTCACCVVMDGTDHDPDAVLDGHPRCRCAMVPITKTWEELLGAQGKGIPDTQPPHRVGVDWLKAQPAAVQRHILGAVKWRAWTKGEFDLPDVVARTRNAQWGTMRRERSLAEIKAGVHADWKDVTAPAAPRAPAVVVPDPVAVRAIVETKTLGEVEAALKVEGLPAQEVADLEAAHLTHLNRLHYGPLLPEPDMAKATVAAEKMTAAALTKGYPSKGYSQTKAIYKAQANGVVGSKVGVVKSLTWEQKITAEKALSLHDADLPEIIRKAAAKQKVEAAALAGQAKADTLMALPTKAQYDEEYYKVLPGGAQSLGLAPWSTAGKAANAEHDMFAAAMEKHYTAAEYVSSLEKAGDNVWVNQQGDIMTLSSDGYGLVTHDGVMSPISATKAHDWVTHGLWNLQEEAADPGLVTTFLKGMTAPHGYLDVDGMESIELALDMVDTKTQKAIIEAVSQAKATLLPPPNADEVATIMDKISAMVGVDPASLVIGSGRTPQQKSDGITAVRLLLGEDPHPNVAHLKSTADLISDSAAKDYAAGPVAEAAAKAALHPGLPFDPERMVPSQGTLGTHGAKVWTDPATGEKWLHKPPKDPTDDFLADLDVAGSALQKRVGLVAPDTFTVTLKGQRGSIQRMHPGAKEAFPSPGMDPAALTAPDLLAVQKEHVLDWLLSNHDGHREQFLRLPGGELVAVDKGQAFRWIGKDRLAWDYHPNSQYGAPEPVYNTLWRSFAQGKADALDPRHGPLADFIAEVEDVSDDEIRDLFRPYATKALARGKLAYPSVDKFLDALVHRKNTLSDDFAGLYDKAAKKRAENLPGWKPAKPAATKAAKVKKGKAQWIDAPAPEEPVAPPTPQAAAKHTFDGWLSKARDRFDANPKKKASSLETSANWGRFQRVIDDRDRTALQELLDRSYLDQRLYDEGIALIDAADAVERAAKAAYDDAYAAFVRQQARWKADLAEWRDANGIVYAEGSLGVDESRLWKSDTEARGWGDSTWPGPLSYSKAERAGIGHYTGNGFQSMNPALRESEGVGATRSVHVRGIDSAMDSAPRVPETIVVYRGTGIDTWELPNGTRPYSASSDDMESLVGTIQHEHGYMSTSIGTSAAFSDKPALLVLRVPEGHKAVWVSNGLSKSGKSERELLLARDFQYVVHAAYRSGDKWVLEAEVVPTGWVKPKGWTAVKSKHTFSSNNDNLEG